jgi:hypothetical protein
MAPTFSRASSSSKAVELANDGIRNEFAHLPFAAQYSLKTFLESVNYLFGTWTWNTCTSSS